MKAKTRVQFPIEAAVLSNRQAFTLPEMMIVMAIFMLLVAGLISTQLFGLKMYNITETKLASTDAGRKVMDHIRGEILSGKTMVVGNGNGTNFVPVPNNQLQIGNALQIYPTTATNSFIRYYLDANNQTLQRMSSIRPNAITIASYITNQLAFQAEDFQGNVLTNSQNNRVIRMVLEFYQMDFATAAAASGGVFDYYRLQTRVTRRLIE